MDDDSVPVRDTSSHREALERLLREEVRSTDVLAKKATKEKSLVTRLSRDELEDKYLKIYDENIVLRKHAWKQEEKIKKLATKLIKVLDDQKKAAAKGALSSRNDLLITEMQSRIGELEKDNNKLNQQLLHAKRKAALTDQLATSRPFTDVPSRIDSRVRKPAADRRQLAPDSPATTVHRQPPDETLQRSAVYDDRPHSGQLIEQLRRQVSQLEEKLSNEEFSRNEYKTKAESLQQELHQLRDEVSRRKDQLAVADNSQLLQLQRDLHDKELQVTGLHQRFANLESQLQLAKQRETDLDQRLLNYQQLLKQEQNKCMDLSLQLDTKATGGSRVDELQRKCESLTRECDVLKKANQDLIESAFDLEREREWRRKESSLMVQIAQLEASLKADVGEKGQALDRLNDERQKADAARTEARQMRAKFFELKQAHEVLQERMALFTGQGDDAVQPDQLAEAIGLIRANKQLGADQSAAALTPSERKQLQKQLRQVEADYASCVMELEKTRNLLSVQYRINKEYESKLRLETQKFDLDRTELEKKLADYTLLVDQKQNRIDQLVKQVHDIAYGTTRYKITDDSVDLGDFPAAGGGSTVDLERGQNLFELHIGSVELTDDGRRLCAKDGSYFCTIVFYDFEVQNTPVSHDLVFDFTSEFVVRVDEFFLRYLNVESATIEFHRTRHGSSDYETLAACQIGLKELLETTPKTSIHREPDLIGVSTELAGVRLGRIQLWMRFRLPMEHSFRLHAQRQLAKTSPVLAKSTAPLDAQSLDNALRILVRSVALDQNVLNLNSAPSVYVIYKFYQFPDRCSSTAEQGYTAKLQDACTFPILRSQEVDNYLKLNRLYIYVFNDGEPAGQDAADQNGHVDDISDYIGLAEVPLLPLVTSSTPYEGSFEVRSADENVCGVIDVSLLWQQPAVAGQQQQQQQLYQDDVDLRRTMEEALKGPADDEPVSDSTLNGDQRATALSTITERSEPPSHSISEVGQTSDGQRQSVRASAVGFASVPEEDVAASTLFAEPDSLEETAGRQPAVGDGAGDDDDVDSGGYDDDDDVVGEEPSTEQRHHRQFDSDDDDIVDGDFEPEPVGTVDNLRAPGQPVEANDDDDWSDESMDLEKPPRASAKPPGPSQQRAEDDGELDDDDDDQDNEEDLVYSTDSEGVVTPSQTRGRKAEQKQQEEHQGGKTGTRSDRMNITIHSLTIDPNSQLLQRDDVDTLYVAYRFLNRPPEELETPYSLPKPDLAGQFNKTHPNTTLEYNFNKTFHVGRKFPGRMDYLRALVEEPDRDQRLVEFSVVNEPAVDSDEFDCEDVARCFVDFKEIYEDGRDVVEQDYPLVSVDDDGQLVGQLNLTINCIDCLRAAMADADMPAATAANAGLSKLPTLA